MKDKWTRRVIIKRISGYVIIFCLVFLLVLTGFTLYGDRAGNFAVVLKEDKVKIAACLTKDFASDQTSHFDVPGVEYLSATTYHALPDSLSQGIGVKNDENKKYMAFSFYLLNLTERDINYDILVEITDELAGTKNENYRPSDALRFLILEESELNDELEGNKSLKEDGTVYARQEDSQEGLDELNAANYPEDKVTYFEKGSEIIQCKENALALGAVKKYTVVMWLEGYDISCTNELIGGRLKMQMNICAY